MTRHREIAHLHYGADDFPDRDRLTQALSRNRQKDVTTDYAPHFADRRAIIVPASTAPARQLGLFDGMETENALARLSTPSLQEGVVRFARITAEIVRRREQGHPENAQQRAAFEAARIGLDAVRPNAARDLRAAFVRDMGLLQEAAAGQPANAIRVIEWERRYRTEPQLRADHFVKTWRQLGDRHELHERRGDERGAQRIAAQMTGLAKTLERDPQLESLLRNRTKELSVPSYLDRPLSQALPQWIGWGRGRGLER